MPVEFKSNYREQDGLHADMMSIFNFVFANICTCSSLSVSQEKRGTITLIPIPNNDSTVLDNLRTMSLLNTDYKT